MGVASARYHAQDRNQGIPSKRFRALKRDTPAPVFGVLKGARHMSATDTESKEDKQENPTLARHCAVFAWLGYLTAFTFYIAIFVAALMTLGLILIRQADMYKFNNLVANLEQRDRAPDDLQKSLERIKNQREGVKSTLAALADNCQSFSGSIIQAETPTATASQSASSSLPGNCNSYVNTAKHKANELLLTENDIQFRLA